MIAKSSVTKEREMKKLKDYKIHTFSNGAVIVLKSIKGKKFTAVRMGFRSGALCDEVAGTAHFLEHVLFLGTEKRTREQIDSDRDTIKRLNAGTSLFTTLVSFKRANRYLDEVFEFASDITVNTKFNTAEINKEREVIRNEIAIAKERDARDVGMHHLTLFSNYFNKPTCAILGDDIDKITRKDLETFRDKHYVAQNFIMFVCSSLPMSKFVKFYEKYIAKNLKVDESYKIATYDFTSKKPSKLQIVKYEQDKVDVKISIEIPFGIHNIKSKLGWLFWTQLITSGSDIYNALRKKGLVYKYYASTTEHSYSTMMSFNFSTAKENIKKVIDEISKGVQNRYKNGISESEFEIIRKRIRISKDESEGSPVEYKLDDMVYAYTEDILIDKIRYEKELKKITIDEINSYIRLYNNKNNKLWVTALGKLTEKDIYTLETIQKKLL